MMAIFKPEPNVEYTLTMKGGPYGPDDEQGNATKGSIKGNYGLQWKYLVHVGDVAHYWYTTERTNEMIEKRGYDTPGSPFTVVKKTVEGKNVGFELSGESYDDIFGDPRTPPEHMTADTDPTKTVPDLESRLVIFSESVNDRFRKMSDEIKRLDGEIAGVRKALEALGEPFPETAESQG